MGICYIVGAGEAPDKGFAPKEDDFVIACDGGYRWCSKQGIRIDLVVGDFDSLGYIPAHPNLIRLTPEKDDTDTKVAVAEGLKRGFDEFTIYGGTGGRVSHTIANIQLLADLAAKGCHAGMIGNHSWYRVICNEEICFDEKMTGYLSVFCLGDTAKGVEESGLKYLLHDATLVKENPVGVSNEFIGQKSRVSVREGMLLLIGEEI